MQAAKYIKGLCEAICQGLAEENELSKRHIKRIVTVQQISQVDTMHQLRSLKVVTTEDHEEFSQEVKQAWVEKTRIKEV